MTDFLDLALAAARDVAREAGQVLLAGIDGTRAVDDKGANDVVTDMDRAADKLIIGRLSTLFPKCGMLTEESGDVAKCSDSDSTDEESMHTWVIDPLDGTTSYLHRHPCYFYGLR